MASALQKYWGGGVTYKSEETSPPWLVSTGSVVFGMSILHDCWCTLLSMYNCAQTTAKQIILILVSGPTLVNCSFLCHRVVLQCVSVNV